MSSNLYPETHNVKQTGQTLQSKPRLLDLFCGAGGAAMGYHRAGFDVVGVDIAPQKNYPFEFHQADALEYVSVVRNWIGATAFAGEFAAIHASPPCQAFTVYKNHGKVGEHPDLIAPLREESDDIPL